MLAIINVKLTQGEFTSQQHLREVAKDIFQNVPSADLQQNAKSLQEHIKHMVNANTYFFIPRPASLALFLWLSAREFEIIIETFPGGNLFDSSESVMSMLNRRLKQRDMSAEIKISLHTPEDGQSYLFGKPNESRLIILWNELKDNLVAFIIGVIIAIIARIWLEQFFQEAVAALISLTLFSLWEGYIVWNKPKKLIYWGIKEHE